MLSRSNYIVKYQYMKKTSLLFILLFLFTSLSQAQLISERTQGKVIIGADIFTDFSTGKKYDNFDLRAINQGVSVYSMFNFKFDNTPHSASVGVGYTGHNYYMKGAYVKQPYNEVTEFVNVPYDYKLSKINVNYIDIPVEVSFRFVDKFKLTAGNLEDPAVATGLNLQQDLSSVSWQQEKLNLLENCWIMIRHTD